MLTLENPIDPSIRFERPRKARLPEIQRRLEAAAGLHREGEDLIAQSAVETTAAKRLEQQITALESEKAELLSRIAAAEKRDCKAELARNRARFHQLYGKVALTPGEQHDLNIVIPSFGWLPLLEKELVILAKTLTSRVVEIDRELANLTAQK